MAFQTVAELAEDEGKFYGDYLTTFFSETGQVRVDIFQRGEWMVAYASFPTGLKPYEATDRYVSNVNEYARQRGFQDKLRMILT